ncbi:MAG: leucine-rich repeat domain-containing protein [Oscillospiraceae bacterium]|jgi:hypothetical protein|nr:leucine-rich repeat domain-containing protein [Oscillospiraceae bacterium]
MKRIFAIMLAAVLVLGVVGCSGDSDSPSRPHAENNQPPQPPSDDIQPAEIPENPASDFEYTMVDGGIAITSYRGSATEVKIPSVIEGANVVAINGAFQNRSAITEIIIPDSVTSIGSNAFEGCIGLTSITIPEGITYIGDSAFVGTGITNITLPDSLTRVESFTCCGWADFPAAVDLSQEENIESNRLHHDGRCDGLTLESVSFKGVTYNVERTGSTWGLPQGFYDAISDT